MLGLKLAGVIMSIREAHHGRITPSTSALTEIRELYWSSLSSKSSVTSPNKYHFRALCSEVYSLADLVPRVTRVMKSLQQVMQPHEAQGVL
jgi:hypothetical protein